MIVLTGKTAIEFEKKARLAEKNRGTIDFSKQYQMMERILEKSTLPNYKKKI